MIYTESSTYSFIFLIIQISIYTYIASAYVTFWTWPHMWLIPDQSTQGVKSINHIFINRNFVYMTHHVTYHVTLFTSQAFIQLYFVSQKCNNTTFFYNYQNHKIDNHIIY